MDERLRRIMTTTGDIPDPFGSREWLEEEHLRVFGTPLPDTVESFEARRLVLDNAGRRREAKTGSAIMSALESEGEK